MGKLDCHHARRMLIHYGLIWGLLPLMGPRVTAQDAAPDIYDVGVARVDVTPRYPIRLNGFGGRREESEGVGLPIWAKAIAISQGDEPPVVLVTLDSLGVRMPMVDSVAAALQERFGLPRENLALTFTHSHCTPKVNGASDTIFSTPIPAEHQAHIDRYTDELLESLIQVTSDAIEQRQSARLEWSVGRVGFAINRRTPGGPVDHSLPVLFVRTLEGELRAIYTTYACHCVTLSYNKIHGDWAGAAQQAMERMHPGIVAMVSIGCGSDSNPDSGVTGANEAIVTEQGAAIAAEVERLLEGPRKTVQGRPQARLDRIELALQELPSRTQLEALAKEASPAGYNAAWQLQQLEKDGKLEGHLDYPIQSIQLGQDLAMVFLAGEVCVDYALKLRQVLRSDKLWLHGYSNDFGAYIPSERLLREGGYGGGAEVVYFALPAMLKTGVEQQILEAVVEQLPESWRVEPGTQGVPPREPEEALRTFQLSPELEIQLVASEPLVQDPVAIDFGLDGRLWVAEMADYARPVDEEFFGQGRVKYLEDRDGDGVYESAQVFVDGLRFPTEVKVWREGVLICDAPDILFCRDTDGDGRADERRVLLTGFATHNPHARVNSLRWGLDGWLYGSCGLFGGVVTTEGGEQVNLTGRDFRWHPDRGEIEPVTGTTQQGRDRDDWNRWYGCDNSTLLRAYPIEDRYLRQSPSVAAPPTQVSPFVGKDPQRLYPAGELVLFKLSGQGGRPTSACGLGIYRDRRLGDAYYGNSFTCEPVNQLVTRRQLILEGAQVQARRADDEATTEFLTSTDRWFRPVQARTGPDGGLWIVDMYRYVIEHPRWIPEETRSQLNVFAGQQRGRIYRVVAKGQKESGWPKVDGARPADLLQWLGDSNGTLRDMVHQYVNWHAMDDVARSAMQKADVKSQTESYAQIMSVAQQQGVLDSATLGRMLEHSDSQVRRWGLQLSEQRGLEEEFLVQQVIDRMQDESADVQRQALWTLGQSPSPLATQALLRSWPLRIEDPVERTAVLVGLGRSVDAREVLIEWILQRRAMPDQAVGFDTELLGVAFDQLDSARLLGLAKRILQTDRDERLSLRDPVFQALLKSSSLIPDGQSSGDWEPVQRAAFELLGDVEARDHAAAECCLDVLLKTSSDRAITRSKLIEYVDSRQSIQLQVQIAVRLAGDMQSKTHWPALLDRLRQGTPQLQAVTLDQWLARSEGRRWLLEQCQDSPEVVRWLSGEQRSKWIEFANDETRQKIEALLHQPGSSSREAILEAYRGALVESGVVARGQVLFEKHCSSCHRLGDQGGQLGPDLGALGNKTPASLLAAVLDPSRDIDARYRNVLIETTDGLTVGGLLLEENASTLRLQVDSKRQITVLRRDVDSLATPSISFMPEGLEKDLSVEDLRDLISYLMSNVQAAKSVSGNRPVDVQPDERGVLRFVAAQAAIFGGDITFEEPLQNIGLWHSVDDFVRWDLELEQAGTYTVQLRYACHPGSAGNQMVVSVGEWHVAKAVPSTGGWDQYQTLELGDVSLSPGRHVLSVTAQGNFQGALMDLHSIELRPMAEK